jgi:hypothetical protein
LVARWGAILGKELSEIPEVEFDDYIIRERAFKDWECGCIDGTYLGRYQKYKEALCAIAEHMRKIGNLKVNVMHEHAPGKLELIIWEPEEFLDKISLKKNNLISVKWRAHMKKYQNSNMKAAGIAKRMKKQKDIMKKRIRAKSKIMQNDMIERARAFRKAMEDIYR